MTSSKIRFFDLFPPPSSSVIFARPPYVTLYFTNPTRIVFNMIFGKILSMVKLKITKSGFSYEYYLKQKSVQLLFAECFRFIE